MADNHVGISSELKQKRIWAASALLAFKEFYTKFSPALAYKEQIILVDRLIHSFHWSLKEHLSARSVGNNLIDGDHDQVVEFLDELSGVDEDHNKSWHEAMQQMMRRRTGQ